MSFKIYCNHLWIAEVKTLAEATEFIKYEKEKYSYFNEGKEDNSYYHIKQIGR